MNKKFLFTATAVLFFSAFLAVDDPFRIFAPLKLSSSNIRFSKILPIIGAIGPESFAFDPIGGGPYTGVSNGQIIKWQENERRWIDFAMTAPERRDICEGSYDHERTEHVCGRPLGMRFNDKTGELYVADAYFGLLVVGRDGGSVTTVAAEAQGVAFRFTNGLDIDQESGAVYFSDSSTSYQRREFVSAIVIGDKTGRLMKYDPESKQVTVLLDNISFANGVALSKDGSFILVAETTNCRILRFWLQTSKAGTWEVFAQLSGFPDNIKRSSNGDFWVAIHSKRGKLLEWIMSYPCIGNALLKLPFNSKKLHSFLVKWRGYALAMRLNEVGAILEVLEDRSGSGLRSISEVEENNGTLWVGSVVLPFAGVYKIQTMY